MKKAYETPSVEVVKFQYKDQVVATSGCPARWEYNFMPGSCEKKAVEWFN